MDISKKHILLSLTFMACMAAVLFWLGREPWFTGGYIKLWHGVVASSENSQHLFDWYTFTHIQHGIGFYFILWIIKRLGKWNISAGTLLLIAIGVECSWEILENTSMVIDRYRAATISLDYYGDSVVNSIGDVIAMIAGFIFTMKSRAWLSIGLFVGLELLLIYFIKDSLILNIIMLAYPSEVIKEWQRR